MPPSSASPEPSAPAPPPDPAAALVALFGAFAVASWAYCAVKGEYNGDFVGMTVTLSQPALLGVLVLAIVPFLALWRLRQAVLRWPRRLAVTIPLRPFAWALAALFAWQIFVTVAYGVGVMLQEVYSAPAAIAPFIQVTNRLNAIHLGTLFILLAPRKARYEAPVGVAMLVLSVLRASLGAFYFLGIALGYKYYDRLFATRRRFVAVIAASLLAVPVLAGALYGLRGALRGEGERELAVADLVFAQLTGRLSSFSDSAYVIQESRWIAGSVSEMEPFYLQLQILGSLVHSRFHPAATPERLLVTERVGFELDTVSFIPGIPGNLVISWMKSPLVFALNLATFVLLALGALVLARQIADPSMRDAGLLLLLSPVMGGVASEMANVVLTLAVVVGAAWLHARPWQRTGAAG